MRGILDRLVNGSLVILDEAPVVAEVRLQIVVHLRRAIGQRLFHVHDGRQFVDVHHDGFGSITGLLFGLGHNSGDRVADVAHLALRENWVSRFLHGFAETVGDLPSARNAANGREVRAGEDADNARHVFGFGCVDGIDGAVCHVRTDEMDVSLAL